MGSLPSRRSAADATLGAFQPPVRDTLVPLLLYKSVFMGDWFEEMLGQERDERVRATLAAVARDTFREAIEVIDTMRAWQGLPTEPDTMEALIQTLQRRILHDLLVFKEGNNEAVLYAAMRAPTDELRRKLVRLADRDRGHADAMRALLGTEPAPGVGAGPRTGVVGAREGRTPGGTLSASLRADLERFRASGTRVSRLVLSPGALRHLRDENLVQPDATAFGLPVDVDFGWAGEAHAFVTEERVRLAELLSRELDEPER